MELLVADVKKTHSQCEEICLPNEIQKYKSKLIENLDMKIKTVKQYFKKYCDIGTCGMSSNTPKT